MNNRDREILDEYKRSRSPFKVAQMFDLDVTSVWKIIESNEAYLQNPPERFEGLGRPELREFIVSKRRIRGARWDNDEPEVALARELYEQGVIDLCSGRDGGWEFLYAIPRKKKQPRPGCWEVQPIR